MASNGSANGDYKAVPRDDNEDPVEARKPSPIASEVINAPILSVAAYCIASITMTVVNKYCVSGAHFSMTLLLLTIQSSVCVASVWIFKKAGVISFRDFDSSDAKKWFPISFLLVTMIYTNAKSLQYLSMAVFTIFKNLTIILIAYGEVLWFGGRVTHLTLASFIVMVLSSIVAAWSDISGTLEKFHSSFSTGDLSSSTSLEVLQGNIGYFWMILTCLTTATYVLSMRKRIKTTGFKDWDTMFYNNLLSIPILAVFSFLFEDWGTANLQRNFPPENRTILLSAIAFSGAAAVGISYTTAWCVRTTSSTTYSMVGALNKLPIALSGIIFFHDSASFGSLSAIGLGFFAGLVYAVAKNNQKKDDQAKERGEAVIPMHLRRT